MTKDEFAAALRKEGYDARSENGVVMVYMNDADYYNNKIWLKIVRIAISSGYNASVGKILKQD